MSRTTARSRLLSAPAIAAMVGALLLLLIALFAETIWGAAATTTVVPERLLGPSLSHPFGTDDLGRDVFARVMVATRLSLLLTLGATAIGMTGGIVVGLVASILPRRPRRVVTGFIDILLSFPWLLLVLFFSAIWGASALGAMLAIGFAGIPSLARLVYTMASSLSGRDFVRAARVVGVGTFGVLGRHVLPNIANPLLVNTAAAASVTLLSFAGLSFLGLGVQAPEYDWGRLLNEGILRIYINPIAAIGPGLAIVLAGLVFTFTSEALTARRGAGIRAVSRLASRAVGIPAEDEDLLETDAAKRPVAETRGLRIAFPDGEGGSVDRVRGVDLVIAPGETVGIVGESGSGKSLTAMALAGLLEEPAVVTADVRRFDGIDMSRPLSRAEASRVGQELGMVFQDPLTSLNPALTIGRQLTEVPEVHMRMSRSDARTRAADALTSVSIPDAREKLRKFPHEFSGGMRQRAMIGMALTGRPRLIIADEPTTALDVTVQRQVMSVLRRAQRETGAAIVFISHDIALVSAFCDRVVVMKDGLIVEELAADRIRKDAQHPYTQALVRCLPDMSSDRTRPLPVISAEAAAPIAEATP
ncbi:dipeptide/oligopeptide/nickel ABC transporter permease/ATP-binding protein [Microbacterium hatanonis]|jgi:ABC-type dipeptide/oligopeptide/nickel transport system ATPase component/ABC-type dipeptide/oligopeptide/nickel transport system permease subunit|uniref:Dipeptide/oligopeptide/nickel ABC transporter permease/ATP-binding protein n=1 Tax=Microbacterium hatanonis TaxID=404366 RepID=A0A5C8HZB1_9MICO|nr:dipeptide/oligopeptide/nickel ABC transporter permease/ATP-binding protein [Microbacterium hatanonis]TXK10404.1 dipeptide/oligopeptide/nickel ABC transporter permease/ATP-binding protein [Microbacterium hatanonis]